MHSPWVKEATEASSSRCCLNPIVGVRSPFVNSFKSVDDSATFQYNFATAATTSLYPYTQFTNHESLPKLQEAFRSFLRAYPGYLETVEADQVRAQEYPHLSVTDHVYLDYIGLGLYSYGQLAASTLSMPSSFPDKPSFFDMGCKSVTFNSAVRDGEQVSDFEDKLRRRIMRFLNISEDDYSIVFTANQLAAFTLVAEAYPFSTNKDLLTVYDHENEAAEALIKCSKNKGVRPMSAEFKWPKLKICYTNLEQMIAGKKNKKSKGYRGLFVFPLQSRVTGSRYSYQWMSMASENGWHVLLDISSLAPKDMDTFGLSIFRPDFLICTCYKVFGDDPFGFSCLIIKKSTIPILNELNIPSSISIVTLIPTATTTPSHPSHQTANLPKGTPPESSTSSSGAFQRTHSGPSNYDQFHVQPQPSEIEQSETSIMYPTTMIGTQVSNFEIKFNALDQADTLGLIMINNRGRFLINWLANALQSLKHPNLPSGHSPVTLYGPRIRFDRAPALAFNVFDWKGDRIDPSLVQKLADRDKISLGVGIIKNVWFSGKNKQQEKVEIHVVTVNLGFLTNFEDVYRVWVFAARFLDADFVEKERWRYLALNHKPVEV
ncbi:hypothetical protein Droror1_Dr00024973 [Drosera rotundifolia]